MANKEAVIAELTDKFRNSNAVLLTEYRGLTVNDLNEIRGSIREHASFAVAKNTLARIAAKAAGVDAFEESLVGPSALVFVHGDVVAVAKALRDFAKQNPLLVLKNGYFDGAAISAEDVLKLADLESREMLLAKLAGAFKASLFGAAYLFKAPLSKTVRTVDSLREKQERAA